MRSIFSWVISFGILELITILLVSVNLLTFLLYVVDKRKAERGKWRISEATLIFFTLACGGIGAFLGMKFARHKTKHIKFQVAVGIGLVIALVPVVHIVHGLTLDRMIRYVEVDFHSENWPTELDGYRITFMTDFHVISDDEMQAIVVELNKRNIDLLLLGGDFSMRNDQYMGTLREIAQVNTVDGIFGVEGNHDDYERIFPLMEQLGLIPLDNSGLLIKEGFYLGGIHDAWNRSPNIRESIAGANADDFILLVSHNPDVSMEQSTEGIDLILSGHTHGGQITFFGVPLYLLRGSISNHGMRFSNGFAQSADGVPVYTSNGIGTYYNIPRIFARPEVVIFFMYSGGER